LALDGDIEGVEKIIENPDFKKIDDYEMGEVLVYAAMYAGMNEDNSVIDAIIAKQHLFSIDNSYIEEALSLVEESEDTRIIEVLTSLKEAS
jgi:hypothetical protein